MNSLQADLVVNGKWTKKVWQLWWRWIRPLTIYCTIYDPDRLIQTALKRNQKSIKPRKVFLSPSFSISVTQLRTWIVSLYCNMTGSGEGRFQMIEADEDAMDKILEATGILLKQVLAVKSIPTDPFRIPIRL